MTSGDPPASASQSAGITGMSRRFAKYSSVVVVRLDLVLHLGSVTCFVILGKIISPSTFPFFHQSRGEFSNIYPLVVTVDS